MLQYLTLLYCTKFYAKLNFIYFIIFLQNQRETRNFQARANYEKRNFLTVYVVLLIPRSTMRPHIHVMTNYIKGVIWQQKNTEYKLWFKPVWHSEIKLKQNSETAWNNFMLISASLAYLFVCSKICFRLLQCSFVSVLFQNVRQEDVNYQISPIVHLEQIKAWYRSFARWYHEHGAGASHAHCNVEPHAFNSLTPTVAIRVNL